MLIFFIILIAIFIVVIKVTRNSGSKQSSATQQHSQYSTTLRTGPNPSAPIVMCKDGVVYKSTGSVIGSYKPSSERDRLIVFDDRNIEIGYVYKNDNNDVKCVFSLHGIPDWRSKCGSRESLWYAAEVISSDATTKAIIDYNDYNPILWASGNALDVGAAFICWARAGYGNKYSDYFNL